MIQTPFGPLPIFDAHTHFFGRSFLAGLGRQLGLAGDAASEVARRLGWDLPAEDPADVGRRWVAEMDRHGVDRMISIHTLPGDLESAAAGVAASDGRLIGYTMINPLEAGAAKNVERAVTQFGFRGVALFPAMFGFAMNSDAVSAVLDVANRHRLNVAANRLLFGSDSTFFPRGWRRDMFDQQMRIFEEAKLTADDVAKILGGNLQELIFSAAAAS